MSMPNVAAAGMMFRAALSGATVKKSQAEPVTLGQNESNPWILNAPIDLLLSCGGLVWLFFGLHYFILGHAAQNSATQVLLLVVILGTHLLSETHNVATLVRVYKDTPTRNAFSFYTKNVALLCACLAMLGLCIPEATSIFVKIYLLWVSQHFTAQTYGLALLYCYKRNYYLNANEKNVFWLLMQSTMAFAVIRQLTYPDWGGGKFLGVSIPFWGPLPVQFSEAAGIILVLMSLLFLGVIARKALLERKIFPLPALMLTATGVLIWVFGKDVTGTLWLYVPAFYHGSQYLVVSTAYYLKEQGFVQNIPSVKIVSLLTQSPALKYFASLILIASFLYIALPRILEQLGVDYALAFAAIFSTINFHHFLTDRAIWKLRDKKTRDLLVA